MKLRSEVKVTDSKLYPHCVVGGSVRDFEHDAAAAHALMQAMREAADGSADVSFYSDDDYQRWIYGRADELLREWGFDSGEVE